VGGRGKQRLGCLVDNIQSYGREGKGSIHNPVDGRGKERREWAIL
jgi:hypothetical protein